MTKILLVEDDKSLREIYGVRLLAEGYDIVSAGDGEEALAMAIKERPALIVSDVMMPKISGFDMLDILRSTTETKDIKVIMMTALSSEDQRQRGEKLGADRYLVKSQVGIEDVVRTVHEVLGDLPGAAPQPSAHQPATTHPSAQPQQPQQPSQTADSSLPRPTAPFSSSTPRPMNLGDRTIHPLQGSPDKQVDVSALMEQELQSAESNSAPSSSQPNTMPPSQNTSLDSNNTAAQTSNTPETSPEVPISRPDIASLSPRPQQLAQPQAPQASQATAQQPPTTNPSTSANQSSNSPTPQPQLPQQPPQNPQPHMQQSPAPQTFSPVQTTTPQPQQPSQPPIPPRP